MLLWHSADAANIKRSTGSGDFNNPALWTPAGAPGSGDSIIIRQGHHLNLTGNSMAEAIVVEQGAQLVISSNHKLTLNGTIMIEGTVEISEGNLDLTQPAAMILGASGVLIWNPADNSAIGATLFTNGIENLHPTSHLIIKKWYSYSQVPIGKVVTGDFGHLTLSSIDNGLLFEWDQENQFEEHRIHGILTIDQGWIVLDKSGNISNTEIGAIHLSNINSYLDLHDGEHSGTIKLTTGSITNVGGVFNGLVNGNGNVEITVNGDFTNLGKSNLILNNGVQSTGNGNVRLKVNGKFKQTLGDFRGIFNITTKSSGTASLEFGSLDVHGGIFMAQYNCHVSGGVSTLKINGDLDIRLNHANNIFRGSGLSTLAGTPSNVQLQMFVGGNMLINGVNNAEVTTSASSGSEIFHTQGDVNISSCRTSFNYGNHQTEIYITGSLVIDNAEVHLSKTKGVLTAEIGENLSLQNGNLNIKGGNGHANLNVRGNYYQSGGKFTMYNNISEPALQIVYTTISGNFTMEGGEFLFTNMPSSDVSHQLSLNGANFSLKNHAVIYQPVNLSNLKFGEIHFDRTGTINYYDKDQTAAISNIIMNITGGCTLSVQEGNMLSPASTAGGYTMLNIKSGSLLELESAKIENRKPQSFSKLLVHDGGRIRTGHAAGLYNGTSDAAVSGINNLDYELQPSSVIEYNGSQNQMITGTGTGIAQSEDHSYGILEINKSSGIAQAGSGQINIRTTLFLNRGELDLNGNNITILNGRSYGITSEEGYIRSEHPSYQTKGTVKWMHLETGTHTIPFGTDEQNLLPLSLNVRKGEGRYFTASTKASIGNNRPLPAGITTLPENGNGEMIIDRWYYINAPGITADIILPYLSEENSTLSSIAEENFSATVWNGAEWKPVGGTGMGKTTESGSVESKNVQQWGHFLLVSNKTGIAPEYPGNGMENSSNIIAGTVHPNPFDREFTAAFSLQKAKPMTINLTQINGKVIKRILTEGKEGENKVYIKTDSTLPNGIYMLEITDGISSVKQKMVKYN